MTGARYIANENPDAEKVETKTIYLASIAWREPAEPDTNDPSKPAQGRYPTDYCKTIKCNSPEELRERIAHYRFLRGSFERFDVQVWQENLKKVDGHWKLDEKHDLLVRESPVLAGSTHRGTPTNG